MILNSQILEPSFRKLENKLKKLVKCVLVLEVAYEEFSKFFGQGHFYVYRVYKERKCSRFIYSLFYTEWKKLKFRR